MNNVVEYYYTIIRGKSILDGDSIELIFKQIINIILAIYWLFMGIGHHWLFFSAINKAAFLFGFLFVLQGILLFVFGPKFEFCLNISSILGLLFIIYALLTALYLGILEDTGVLAAGVCGTILMLLPHKKQPTSEEKQASA